MKRNDYILLRIRIFFTILRKGKVSVRKLLNVARCSIACLLRLRRFGGAPFMINFELWNECNSNCVFCRTARGEIYDQRPSSTGFIEKGTMGLEMFQDIVRQVRKDLLMAVLYINGEPLLYKDLYRAVGFATENRVATMIATNGILLTPENGKKLLDAGLDFIKIAVSAFTQPVYRIQHRCGDIEKIKANIDALAQANEKGRYGCLIMVDYIHYRHSAPELEQFRSFCDDRGMMFNVRLGNAKGMEETEGGLSTGMPTPPLRAACDFPWKALSVNWNGDLFPCCDFVVWSRSQPYARHETGTTNIYEVWNGDKAAAFRQVLSRQGRSAVDICAHCTRSGTAFKY